MGTRYLFPLVATVAVAGLAVLEAARVSRDLGTPRERHGSAYAGSAECARCHPSHDASWRRTYHRTMTAEATPESVVAPFDGRTLRYLGITVTLERAPDGAYRMTFTDARGRFLRRAGVARTVGSHRFQQFLAKDGEVYVRLPVAWSVEDQRFFPMNGAFLTADPPPRADVSDTLDDVDRHVTRWNDNCVFCHNVAPDPGLAPDGRFHTTTAELGVACEACHGPAAEHARANADPFRRWALALGHAPDPTVTSPRRLSASRSAEVCGRCHGQRIAPDVGRFLAHGDPFVPGDDLARESTPLRRDTPLHGDRTAFAARFWADGTPRLTAYEYQGLLLSPCRDGDLTCTTCHGMHEGDPSGQVRPRAVGDRACTGCHRALADDDALARHSGHRAAGAGARCAGCHMPRIVYGLVGARISHRIESPDPARAEALGRPDACTGCHADETRAWAVREAARLWPSSRRAAAPVGDAASVPEATRALLGGDPIVRAIAADALGGDGARPDAAHRAERLGALLDAMEHDAYPAVRRIAWRSARALVPSAPLADFEPTADAAARGAVVARVRAALHPPAPSPALVARLRALADEQAIEIGE